MSKPVVSVIIPTYNRRKLLPRGIESVLSQSVAELEVIVVDDGSADGTRDWVGGLCDPRVRLIPRTHCGNVASLRNAGIAASSAPYVAFLDSDDVWLPDKIERQLRGEPFGWSFGSIRVEPGAKVIHAWPAVGRALAKAVLTTSLAVPVSSLLVLREILDALGGFSENPKINFREDWHLAVRLALRNPTPYVPEGVLAVVHEHPERSTHGVVNPHALSARAYLDLLRSGIPGALWGPALYRLCGHLWRSRAGW